MAKGVSKDSVVIRWLKKIFSWQVISALLTILSVVYAYFQFRHDKGGDLTAYVDNIEVLGGERTDIVVFMESANIDASNLPISPILKNNKEYSVRDFLLQYKVTADRLEFTPSVFYTPFVSGDNTTLRYKENTLYSFTSVESPIDQITSVTNNSHLQVRLRATYDGISEPYEHIVNATFYIEPRLRSTSFSEWRAQCEKKVVTHTEALKYNVFYLADNQIASNLVVTTSALEKATVTSNNVAENTESSPKPSSNTAPSPSAKISKPKPTSITTDVETSGFSFDYAPIEVKGVEMMRLEDNTLVATIDFEPSSEKREACFVFEYVITSNKRVFTDIEFRTIYPRDSQEQISFYNNSDRVKLVGFAQENPNLQQYIDVTTNGNMARVTNKAKVPIGVVVGTKSGKSTTLFSQHLVPREYFLFNLDSDSVLSSTRTFEIPEIEDEDWRVTTWQKAFKNSDLTTNWFWLVIILLAIFPNALLLFSVIMFLIVTIFEGDSLSEFFSELVSTPKDLIRDREWTYIIIFGLSIISVFVMIIRLLMVLYF